MINEYLAYPKINYQKEFSLLALWDWLLDKLDVGNRRFVSAYEKGCEHSGEAWREIVDEQEQEIQMLRENYHRLFRRLQMRSIKDRIIKERISAIIEEETHG